MAGCITLDVITEIFANYDSSLEVIAFEVKKGPTEVHYLSVMHSIEVKLKKRGADESTQFTRHLVFKTIPDNPIRQSHIRDSKLFTKESVMYMEALPKLSAFSGWKSFPESLHAISKEGMEYIAMEDLTKKGFRVTDRLKGLDWDHSALFIKELAKFHASSFILYNGDGENMQADFPDIKETAWVLVNDAPPDTMKVFMSNTFRDIENMLKEEKMDHLIPKVCKAMGENALKIMSKLVTIPETFPSVILHGDCWTNNLMFKYDDETGRPIELKFVDFQVSKISSRCVDLSYGMYTSVNTSVLNERLDELLKLYFDSFNEFSVELGATLPLTFNGRDLTWELFLEEWKIYNYSAVVSGLLLIPVMYTDPDNGIDLDLMEESDFNTKEGEKNNFAHMWEFRTMREKLINFIRFHVPEEYSHFQL